MMYISFGIPVDFSSEFESFFIFVADFETFGPLVKSSAILFLLKSEDMNDRC